MELGYPDTQIKFIKDEAAAGAPKQARPAAPAPEAKTAAATTTSKRAAAPASPERDKAAAATTGKDDFKNDPLIKKALEIFKGRIVEIRS